MKDGKLKKIKHKKTTVICVGLKFQSWSFNPKSNWLKLAESPLSQHLQLGEIPPLVDCFYWDMFLINLQHSAHRCKEECVCEACRNTTVSMERVCSLSSPDSSLSTSSFVSNSLQSSPSVSPCKRPNRLASTQTIKTSYTASVWPIES